MIITGGINKGRKVKTVNSREVRPTSAKVRESIFNIIQSSIAGSVMLDLFAGSGIMGFEALSRGAKKVVFVEKNFKIAEVLKENLAQFDCDCELIITDAVLAPDRLKGSKFNIIFIDPPYVMSNIIKPVLWKIKDNNLLSEQGIVIIEHSPDYNAGEAGKNTGFEILKEKKYGDTVITILF